VAAQETTRREVMISRVENAPLVGIQLIKLFKLEDWLGSLWRARSASGTSPSPIHRIQSRKP